MIAVFQAVLFHVPRLLEPPVGIEIRYILLVFYICDCSVPSSAVSCTPLARTPCGYRDTLRIVSILCIYDFMYMIAVFQAVLFHVPRLLEPLLVEYQACEFHSLRTLSSAMCWTVCLLCLWKVVSLMA